MKTAIAIVILLLISASLYSQINDSPIVKYLVDKSIKDSIDVNTETHNNVTMGKMECIMIANDDTLFDSHKKGKKISFFVMPFLSHDSIQLLGFAGMFAGFGFNALIKGDSCQIYHYVKTDDSEIYKLNKTDTTYSIGLNVPSIKSKLILTNKLEYKEGESIEGFVELESREYYEKANGIEKKYRIYIRAYFKGIIKKMQ